MDIKLTKDALVNVLNPEAKIVSFEAFNYTSIQIFEPNKLRINDTWLNKEVFNPAEVQLQAF